MKKIKNVKMNLTISPEFYQVLQENAQSDYVKVATWTKQYLMKCLLEKNNMESKCITQNGTTMGL